MTIAEMREMYSDTDAICRDLWPRGRKCDDKGALRIVSARQIRNAIDKHSEREGRITETLNSMKRDSTLDWSIEESASPGKYILCRKAFYLRQPNGPQIVL